MREITEVGMETQRAVLAPGKSKVVEVRADDLWNCSGIDLVEGATYKFEVLEATDWQDNTIPATPAKGWTTWQRYLFFPFRFLARYPRANWYTLIGGIGRDPKLFFFIGDGVRIGAPANGEFVAFANDDSRRYENNRGRLKLRVCRSES